MNQAFFQKLLSYLASKAGLRKVCLMLLIIDAMAIHKGTWWDAKKKMYVGHVDYGTALIEAEEDLATEVLVFFG